MINYVILVADESDELLRLLKTLKASSVNMQDVIVVTDSGRTSEKISKIIKDFSLISFSNPLDMDFAQQRNFANSKCWQPYIFHIDADEVVSHMLLQRLPDILRANPTVDIIGIPRLNYLDEDININEYPEFDDKQKPDNIGRINWPDHQLRIMKNISEIRWVGKVHEIPQGGRVGLLPAVPSNCLVHQKVASIQLKHLRMYTQIKR